MDVIVYRPSKTGWNHNHFKMFNLSFHARVCEPGKAVSDTPFIHIGVSGSTEIPKFNLPESAIANYKEYKDLIKKIEEQKEKEEAERIEKEWRAKHVRNIFIQGIS